MPSPVLTLRPACAADFPAALALLAEARAYQLSVGHPQWGADYPALADLRRDVAAAAAHVLLADGVVAGYAALYDGDAAFDRCAFWDAGVRYCVVHRFALSDRYRGRGLGRAFLLALQAAAARRGAVELRYDTGLHNEPMQRLGAALGYACMGAHEFPWGPRLAYRLRI